MENKDKLRPHHDHGGIERQKQGISSFDRYDSKCIFDAFALKEGDSFLDLGCGAGDYALRAAEAVGPAGTVYAVDKWEEVISVVSGKAAARGLANVKGLVADIRRPLPLVDNGVDVCFIGQVLHGFDFDEDGKTLFGELARVLKPGGCFWILEFKKEETGFGPPLEIRLSSQDLERVVKEYGFKKTDLVDLEYSYMARFSRSEAPLTK